MREPRPMIEDVVMMDERGVGWVYCGSVERFHGRRVAVMDDCDCPECRYLDPFDEARRVIVKFEDGLLLLHARCSSFTPPTRWPN